MTLKKTLNYTTILGTILLGILMLYLYMQGYLQDPAALQTLLKHTGFMAPLLFIAIQIFQVIIPVIPGGVTSAIGVIAFGSFWGFIYNYAGICAGSIILFLLVRQYGKPFILKFMDEKQFNKYAGWLDKGKKFDWFFASAIFFPAAPDDLLCMIAALTKMSLNKFTWIILLGKPAALIVYSMSLSSLIQWIF